MKRIAVEATECESGYDQVKEGIERAIRRNPGLEIVVVPGYDNLPEGYKPFGGEMPKEYFLMEEIEQEAFLRERISKKAIPKGVKEHNFIPALRTYNHPDTASHFDSSIYKVMRRLRRGKVDAVISPGDTIGTVISSSRNLKRISGNFKPVIAVPMPFNNVLIDGGATVEDVSEEDLYNQAVMGRAFSEAYLKTENPLIGLLNVGEERYKGPEVVRDAQDLIERLKDKGWNISDKFFEGNFFARHEESVGVVDGFTGNNLLKASEEAAKLPINSLRKYINRQFPIFTLFAYIGCFFPFLRIRKEFDWRNYAVGPLLGYNGNIMVCHGRSDAKAIDNAILKTDHYLDCGVLDKVKEAIEKNKLY